MGGLPDVFTPIRDFIELGGPVLYAIMAVVFLMWTFIIERYWYLKMVYPKRRDDVIAAWDARLDTTSWYAKRIRRRLISEISQGLHRNVKMIQTLVALCPLLGLLGTVSGMVVVFHIMAFAGTGNPRAMASGVSQATVPTMAGMVAAISGIYFATRLQNHADDETEEMEDLLQHH